MTRKLSAAQVVEINRQLQDCVHAVTGPDALEGAVNAAFQTMFGRELHPSVEEQAVALLYGVAKAHAFFDGNKRTAWLTFTVFLDLNGIRLSESETGYQDDLVVDLVENRIGRDEILLWLRDQLE